MSGSSDKRRDADRGKWAVTISALLSEPTHAAAAKKAGVGEATVRRWMRNPAFLSLYRAARRQVVDVAVAKLQSSSAAAVVALERNLTCGAPGAEIRAAMAVLELALKGVELDDLMLRIEVLERKANEVTK